MKKIIVFVSLFILCMPLFTLAHPGHGGTDGYTIIHYFVEPMHAVVTLSALFGAVAYIRYSRRNKQEN